jgi:hypothetical protein
VFVWEDQAGFDPTGSPAAPADLELALDTSKTDALFDAWLATDTSALPHAGPGAECYATVSFRACATCQETRIPTYENASQLAPEMEPVWSWFDANVQTSASAAHPRTYCRF